MYSVKFCTNKKQISHEKLLLREKTDQKRPQFCWQLSEAALKAHGAKGRYANMLAGTILDLFRQSCCRPEASSVSQH